MRHRQLAATAAGIALALGAVGCTSGGSSASKHDGSSPTATASATASSQPQSAGDVVLAADKTTTAQSTAQFSLTEGIAAAGHDVTIKANGAEDFTHHSFDMTMHISDEQLSMREVNNHLYMRLPASIGKRLTGGKPWLDIDLSKLGGKGNSLSQLGSGQTNPSNMLAYLQGISSGGTKQVGTATIRGVKTTEYAGNVNFKKALGKMPAFERKSVKQDLASAHLPATIPIKVWVDSAHLVRQIQDVVDVSVPGAGSVKATVTMQYFGFGKAVHVTAPPASQRQSLTSKLSGLLAA